MDYTELSNSIRMMMNAQGVDEKYIDKEETSLVSLKIC